MSGEATGGRKVCSRTVAGGNRSFPRRSCGGPEEGDFRTADGFPPIHRGHAESLPRRRHGKFSAHIRERAESSEGCGKFSAHTQECARRRVRKVFRPYTGDCAERFSAHTQEVVRTSFPHIHRNSGGQLFRTYTEEFRRTVFRPSTGALGRCGTCGA